MRRLILSLAAALLAGCGSDSGGSPIGTASFSGTVHGQPFSPKDALSGSTSTGGGHSASVLVITDRAGLCSLPGATPKNGRAMVVLLSDNNATPTAAGTFQVTGILSSNPPPKVAYVLFFVYDNTCNDVSAQEASGASGTVTLTQPGNALAGSFDFTFDSGDHVTGTFAAGACAGFSTSADAGSSCQ